MVFEKSIGAVVFRRKENREIFFLLLQYPSKNKNYYAFVKGHQEIGETDEETLKRELKEETGIEEIKIIPDFEEKEEYIFRDIYKKPENPPLVKKEVIYYLVETFSKEVKLSKEHLSYQWLKFEEAKELLRFKQSKEIIEKAFLFLSKKVS